MSRRKSPIKLICKQPFKKFGDDMKICRWKAVGTLRAVEFHSRDSDEIAIVHPSTRKAGAWQVSWFDAKGPYGDQQRSTLDEALAEISPRRFKLKSFG